MECKYQDNLPNIKNTYKHDYLWINLVKNKPNHNQLYFYLDNGSESTIFFDLELKNNFCIGVDKFLSNTTYVIVNSYKESYLLIYVANFTNFSFLDMTFVIDANYIYISDLVVSYNKYRLTTFVYAKGMFLEPDQSDFQECIIQYDNKTNFIIYKVPYAYESLEYAISRGRWVYRITNFYNSTTVSNIKRIYDRTLPNDDFLQIVSSNGNSERYIIGMHYNKTTITPSKDFSFDDVYPIEIIDKSELSNSSEIKRENVAFYLDLQDSLHNIDGFKGGIINYTTS